MEFKRQIVNSNLVTLRAIAIIIVVLGHSIILYDPSWAIYSPKQEFPLFLYLKQIINVIQMPLFFSISGYLYFFSIQKYSFDQILIKKIRRLLIPYFMIGFIYMDPIKIILKVPNHNNILELIKFQILGEMNGHLWFLYTLFALFLLFKILHMLNLIGKKNFIFDLLILLCLFLLNIYNGKFVPFTNIALYSIFFYAGFLVNEYSFIFENNRKYIQETQTILIVIIILLIFLLCIDVVPYRFFKSLFACAFILFIYLVDFKFLNHNHIMNLISNNSFGIYLFHSPLIYITYTYFRDCSPIYVLFVNFVFWGLISLFITIGIRRTKMKFIIGE